ncbi:MAG: hypothetical protein A3F84_06950 [Candidatus Handelsmanbacteria bacterium RIFCSPLOWO2_12_FULL_64_10]|uniref:Uncharacterized protein n=1 Tax=Handelsmanbacteria sp. (strain RIFCSPLOWO2_12_FULL_64_10) TaxID=1817868 RepID=A0A1F6CQQ8_HANXR|nr:MAG: hypothetical protein A3F84_06950 [Candidatus Handelsmanbacteria bacterium RIFCSPLOWO2_12_FULL_64_10]
MAEAENDFVKRVEALAEQDGRYRKEAYLFLYAALEYTVRRLGRDKAQTQAERHVTGQELSRGVAEFAREQYGPMARPVLEHWGVRRTRDFGEMVFLLVNAGMMSKTEQDRIEDFADVYDFGKEFDWRRRGRQKIDLKNIKNM